MTGRKREDQEGMRKKPRRKKMKKNNDRFNGFVCF